MKKIIRTICLFSDDITSTELHTLKKISSILKKNNFSIQTNRICLSRYRSFDEKVIMDNGLLLSMGALTINEFKKHFKDFLSFKTKCINLDLTNENIGMEHIDILFKIIKDQPSNTFNFSYGFNIPHSSPFFPSTKFSQRGFSIGLQPTDLAENCKTLDEWLSNMKTIWDEINFLLTPISGYLGIDSSIASLHEDSGSLINFIKKIGYDFNHSATTNVYTTISSFIKKMNPKPVGFCGIMFPCLEDYELADEYSDGNFNIERNIYLSLHSSVGIDVYPIGINQNKTRVLEIIKLVQDLSNKFTKPLSIRFVSDGKAKIGEKSEFKNPYLRDVIINEI